MFQKSTFFVEVTFILICTFSELQSLELDDKSIAQEPRTDSKKMEDVEELDRYAINKDINYV